MNPSTLTSRKNLDSSNGVLYNTGTTLENSFRMATSSRRSRSFCSSSSTSCSSSHNSPQSPNTPLQYTGVPFSWEHQPGVPFSWEHQPGVPKRPSSAPPSDFSKVTTEILPLPPAAPSYSIHSQRFNVDAIRKKKQQEADDGDPFVTALMECSKDQSLENCNRKVSKTLSARLGGIYLSYSCKNSCSVSESTVFIRRSPYDLFNRADLQ